MDGPQDLGGRMGFGPVRPEPDEPVFHAVWEGRALGLVLGCGALGYWNIDGGRHARESLPPVIYLSASYYEIWTRALVNSLISHGELTEAELDAGEMQQRGKRADRCLAPADVARALAKGGPSLREVESAPQFAVGDRVRTLNMRKAGHTRMPAYAREKTGVIEAVNGAHVFPDSAAHGHGEAPQWLYTVVFDGPTLWGPESDPALTVSIEAWESYLERA